jgi:hypothetical protein
MKLKVIILLISLLSGSIEAQTIHYNAFSHNDYERPRPLFDALSFQFNCVEADLWLIDGELYVSHDSVAPNPDITFEKLYLLPLVERIKKNGGKVYPGSDRPFYLMVDCKTDGEAMYPVLKKKLEPYESLFCHEKDGKLQESAVLFYLSGRSPRKEKLEKMREYIRQTHAEGKLFRWWGAPDTPLFKKLFIKEGMDLIGADDLKALSLILQNP